jgi:hypothetical protein
LLKLSIGAFDNLIGGDPGERRKIQDYLYASSALPIYWEEMKMM